MIRPINDRVFVERVDEERVNERGIYLPIADMARPIRARVVAAGPGRLRRDGARMPMAVREGDLVVFATHSGIGATVDGEDLTVLREEDILAVIPFEKAACLADRHVPEVA
jgi:chaperonin GroES